MKKRVKIPCSGEELAQHFIDAQTVLGDTNRLVKFHPDPYFDIRDRIKREIIRLNPGKFPITI